MYLIDKIENRKELTNEVSIETLVDRQNTTKSGLYFDFVRVLNLQSLRDLHDEELISDDDYHKAKSQHKQIFGEMAMLDINCFVLLENEDCTEISCYSNEIDANKCASQKANDMLDSYSGDVHIDAIVFKDREAYISYLEDNQSAE